MYCAAIKPTDVANGPGIRVSLFVSGCTHFCRDCFNEEAWDFGYGVPFTQETVGEIIRNLDHSYIAGFTLLGGEPLHPANREAVLQVVSQVRNRFPEKSIWCYTGYELDRELMPQMETEGDVLYQLLSQIDVLVDGRFMPEYKDLTLRFKGSSNQRIIRMPETLESGAIVLW